MKTLLGFLSLVLFLVLGFVMTYFYQRAQIEQHKADAQHMMEQVSRITTSLTDIPEDAGSQTHSYSTENRSSENRYSESY